MTCWNCERHVVVCFCDGMLSDLMYGLYGMMAGALIGTVAALLYNFFIYPH
jgi:hypothetical protein